MPWFFTLAQLRVIKVKSESGIVKSFGVPAARILKILSEAAYLHRKKRRYKTAAFRFLSEPLRGHRAKAFS